MGVWSDSFFNRIEIRETIGGNGNEFFGQFYQGMTPFLECEGDFDGDGDADGTDLATFEADFGRTDCGGGLPCQGDFDNDNDVDGSDLAKFAEDFGRTDCP